MGSNYKLNYNVDMVFCIDVTGSMGEFIKSVQTNALNLYQDISKVMQEKGKHIDSLRIRIIAFRDYKYDGKDAMLVTNFFDLPDDVEDLKACLDCLEAKGGGDDPEDGFEALAYAMKSDWNNEGTKKRHVIVLWTDDEAHKLGFGKESEYYPKGMPEDFKALTAWWGSANAPGFMDQDAKRLILFTPGTENWNKISDSWDKVMHFPSEAANGLQEYEYKQILSCVAQTI